MDTHSSHLTAPLRSSRSSQSPSPSHSASASATSSLHKRKLTASEDHAPSNDDLESVSVRNESDDSEEFEEDVLNDDDEEEVYDDTSIRNFTVSRLESSGVGVGGRNVKAKVENNTVKVEPSEVAKDASGGAVKEETVKSIFTENLQTSGAYCGREESLKREEEAGKLKFVCVSNDKIDEHMIWLIGLKNIFARQLPNMPKEYIVRLVMDRGHKSVMVIRRNTVVGGITYRPYMRPRYWENMINSDGLDRTDSIGNDSKNMAENIRGSRLVSQRSKTLKQAIQQYTPVQVYIGKFKQIPTRFIKIIAVCGRSPEVLNECSEVENWLRKKKQLQDSLPKHADPVLLLSDIKNKSETLDRLCRPIMTKPRSAPPKPATPEAPASPVPAQSDAAPADTTPLRRGETYTVGRRMSIKHLHLAITSVPIVKHAFRTRRGSPLRQLYGWQATNKGIRARNFHFHGFSERK